MGKKVKVAKLSKCSNLRHTKQRLKLSTLVAAAAASRQQEPPQVPRSCSELGPNQREDRHRSQAAPQMPSQAGQQVYFAQPGTPQTYAVGGPAHFQPMPSNAPQVYTIGTSVQQQYPQSQTAAAVPQQVFSASAGAAQRPQVYAQTASPQGQQFYPQAGQQQQQAFYQVGGTAPQTMELARQPAQVIYAGQQQSPAPVHSQQAPPAASPSMGSVQVVRLQQPQQQVQYAGQPAYANQVQPATYQNQQYQQQQQQPQHQQQQYQQQPYHQQQPISVGGQGVHAQQATQVVYAQPRAQQQPMAVGNAVIASQAQQQFVQQQQQRPIQQQQQQSTYYAQPAGSAQAQVNVQARPPQAPQAQQYQRSDGVTYRPPKVRELQPRGRRSIDMGETEGPPQFVSHPVAQLAVGEGDGCAIKAVIRPAGDPTLEVVWLKDGVVLDASSRQYASLDRGYAVFQILYTNVSDSGEYCCLAKTSQGQAQSSGCLITVVPEDNVITETQLPEESMVDNLAAMESRMTLNGEPKRLEEKAFPPPTIVRPLLPQLNLKENERAKFETFVQPANDPSLNVEWYKDGKPLKTGCRFSTTLDRGFAILDIHYCYAEDSGDYSCVVTNSAGSVQSNIVQLSCRAGVGIVTDSVLSEDSISYLRNLDSMDNSTMASYDMRYQEAEEAPSAPSFEVSPQETTAIEGSPVRLLVKAAGSPPPRVQWFINGDVLPTSGGGGAWRIYCDGGISYLELNRCGPPGEFQVTVVAKNKMGEASASCTLYVEPQPDYRPDLKHVEPENPFKKMISLKKVERTQELNKALSKPKAKALDLRKLERRESQTSFEAAEAENLYSRVQASLRTSRINSEAPPMQNASAAQMMREGAPTPQPRPPAQPRPPQPQPQPVAQQQQPPRAKAPPPQPQPQFQPPPQQPTVVQAAPQPQPPPPQPPAQPVAPPPPPVQPVAPPPPPAQPVAPPPPPAQPVAPPPPPAQPVAPPPPPPPPPPPKEPTPPPPAPAPEPVSEPQQSAVQVAAGMMKDPEPEYLVTSTDAEFSIEI
ncbi:hypothetical protein SprV_0501981800 [Sparganum proliferum]